MVNIRMRDRQDIKKEVRKARKVQNEMNKLEK